MWNLTLLITDDTQIFQEVIKMGMQKVKFDVHVAIKHFKTLQKLLDNFGVFFYCHVLKKMFDNNFECQSRILSCNSLIVLMTCLSLMCCRIRGHPKTPVFIFSKNRFEIFEMRYLKQSRSVDK